MAYNPQNPNGSATSANSSPVVIASDQAAVPVSGTFYQATQPVSIASSVAVTGTFWQATQPVSGTVTANAGTGTMNVTLVSATTGGDTTYHLVSPAGTNAASIVTGQRKVTGWYIYNSNASARKVNLYNINVAPTMGTTVPTLAIVIPGLAAANVSFPTGLDFSTGISISTVTDLTDLGTTGVGLNDLIINLFYK
jgi:hypothetical protein